MEEREKQLEELQTKMTRIDKEVTMILQSLQWDQKHLLEGPDMVSCPYDASHRMPSSSLNEHTKSCFLRTQGYNCDDEFLPSPVNISATSLIKFDTDQIRQIIEDAASIMPFTRGRGSWSPQPLSLAELQRRYSADERRAVHDAVVAAAPGCEGLADLELPSGGGSGHAAQSRMNCRLALLAAQRDLKRRRAKHRQPPRTAHYSDVLRHVIAAQMEMYAETQAEKVSKNLPQEYEKPVKSVERRQLSPNLSERFKSYNDQRHSADRNIRRNHDVHSKSKNNDYSERAHRKDYKDRDRGDRKRRHEIEVPNSRHSRQSEDYKGRDSGSKRSVDDRDRRERSRDHHDKYKGDDDRYGSKRYKTDKQTFDRDDDRREKRDHDYNNKRRDKSKDFQSSDYYNRYYGNGSK